MSCPIKTYIKTLAEIPAEEISNEYGINPPPNLLFVKSSEKDKFFAESQITDDINTFYATYDEATKHLKWNKRSSLIQGTSFAL